MERKNCPSCTHENRPENRYCTKCGTKLVRCAQPGPRLVMLHGAPEKAVYVLDVERSTMGRDAENSVVLGDQQISKQHAAITTHGGSYWIEDLESRNGVYVNGKRVKERQQLSDGNLIKLGSTILRFEATGQGQV